MIIYTPVWGQPYLEWFEKGLLESFKWPQNYAALANSKWEIFTSPEDLGYVKSFNFPIETSVHTTDNAYTGLIPTIEKCLSQNQPMLMATADMIFADGTINTFLKYGKNPGAAVSMAHVRVLPEFLSAMNLLGKNRKTELMVTYAWEYLHDSWLYAQIGRNPTNSHQGGVSWRYVTSNVIGVQHRLPNTFFVNFLQSDLDYFRGQTIFNVWDTYWPGVQLIEQQRNRIIGSSDAAFIVELTEGHMNVPGRQDGPTEDSYHMDYLHNRISRQFVTIFRMN